MNKPARQAVKEAGSGLITAFENVGLLYLVFKGALGVREDVVEQYDGWVGLYKASLDGGIGWSTSSSILFLALGLLGLTAKLLGIKEKVRQVLVWFTETFGSRSVG